jgi:excisionase family DNA binding protein
MDECFYSTSEFAALHGVSTRTVQRWIQQGLIFAVRVGRGFQIGCDEVNPQLFDVPEPEPEIIDVAPEDIFPEEPEEEDPEFESEFHFEVASFGLFDDNDLRRIETTFSGAVDYARDIPLPAEMISIIQDPNMRVFRVRVDYSEERFIELTS